MLWRMDEMLWYISPHTLINFYSVFRSVFNSTLDLFQSRAPFAQLPTALQQTLEKKKRPVQPNNWVRLDPEHVSTVYWYILHCSDAIKTPPKGLRKCYFFSCSQLKTHIWQRTAAERKISATSFFFFQIAPPFLCNSSCSRIYELFINVLGLSPSLFFREIII